MASAGLVVWTGRGLQCLKCDQQIEARDGNMELAVDLHMEAHRNLESTTRQETERSLLDTSTGKTQLDSSYNCPVCKENVEIKYNDVKLSLKLHSMKHQGTADKRPDDQLSSCSGKSKNSSKKNNQEEPHLVADKLSNSSNGKSKQSNKKTNKEPTQPPGQKSETIILDDIFNALPLGLKAHRGFMQKLADGKTNCNVCNLTIENSISEHLKTKSHEDNAITFLKMFISKDLLSDLDFVSFYGSNLCCNLCKCKIDLCSKNPHETIVNIMIHNAQKTHVKGNSSPGCQSDDISALLQSLSQTNPVINENKDYINVKMQPQISCNLCYKQITYDGDKINLLKNFNGHFTSAGHAKYKETASVLKIFNKLNVPGREKHKFTPAKGNVHCSQCACTIEADIKKLEDHVKASSLTQSGGNTKLSFSKQLDEALKIDNASLQNSTSVQQVGSKGEIGIIQRLLKTMPAQFHRVDYVVLSDKGQVSCLLCNCTIPATHVNLKSHLTGNKHKKNEEVRQTETMLPEASAASSGVDTCQVSQIIDKFFNVLLRKDPVMASHESILVKFEDGKHFLCNLCGVLIPSSQDLNNFRASLYSHVQSEMHKHLYSKHNQSNSVNTFSRGINKVSPTSIQGLFEALPPSLGSERQFIKMNQCGSTNVLFCTVCKVKVPAHVQFLQDHLQGASHADGVKKHNSGVVQKLAGLSMDNNSSQDAMVHRLMTTDKVIKSNAKYIVKKGEDYFCTLCQATIKQAYEPQVLKDNFLSHFAGQKHYKSSEKVVSDLLDKLVVSNPVIKAEKSFMKIQNKTVYCTLCSVAMPSGVEEGPFTKNIVSHFSGSKHKAKKIPELVTKPMNQPAKTSQPIKPRNPTNNPFLSGHNSTGNHPSYFQPPAPPHMTAPPHINMMSTQPFMTHQPNVPFMGQQNMYANPNSNFNNGNSFNFVADAFKTVSLPLQSDIKYITSGSIDGYLTCTLCSNTINPHYLNNHLLGDKHMQEKKAFEEKTSRFRQNM